MVEYHGWITLRDSPSEGDERRTDELAHRLERSVARLQSEHRVLGMKVINANHVMWMAGYTNHWSADIEEILRLLSEVADKAPGSYGLLYVWNDESDPENAFQVWRIAKGKVTEHEDTLLSPCIPTIENQCD
jgi:hypothetical protein